MIFVLRIRIFAHVDTILFTIPLINDYPLQYNTSGYRSRRFITTIIIIMFLANTEN